MYECPSMYKYMYVAKLMHLYCILIKENLSYKGGLKIVFNGARLLWNFKMIFFLVCKKITLHDKLKTKN